MVGRQRTAVDWTCPHCGLPLLRLSSTVGTAAEITPERLSIWHRLAGRIVLLTQIYWILIAIILLSDIPVIRYLGLLPNYQDQLSAFSNFWLTGLVGFTILWNAPIFILTYRYRKDPFITAQRVRLYAASENWVLLFFAVVFVLMILASAFRPPTPEIYTLVVILGLLATALGVFWFLGTAMAGTSLTKYLGKYGTRQALLSLADSIQVPNILRPKTSAPLFGQLHGIMYSMLSNGYPRLRFSELDNLVSSTALALNIGTGDEKEAVVAFLRKLDELTVVGRRKPLEAANQLLIEIEKLMSRVSRLDSIRFHSSLEGAWGRGYFGLLASSISPYANILAILLAAASLVAYLILR